VLQSIADGIRDDRICDDLRPVVQRQLGREHVDLPIERSSSISHRSCASVDDSLRIPMSSKISTSGFATVLRSCSDQGDLPSSPLY